MEMQEQGYYIRKMQRDDLEKVTALEAACFSMPWRYQDFEEALVNPHRVYLVAETDNREIIGGCMLTDIAGEGEITNVAVDERFRGQKIATALLSKLLAYGFQEYGIHAYTLEVRRQNSPAIRLYENAGFRPEGIRPNFYEKPKDDAIIMWKR